jgi:Arc/MetJ-type ribon-helix-helix transcriptional regulator
MSFIDTGRVPHCKTHYRIYDDTMGQFVTRIDDDLARAIDQLVEEGVFHSRSEAVRKSLTATLDAHRRIRLGRETNEGYSRVPETDEELRLAEAVATLMIAAEPWDDDLIDDAAG